MILKISNLENFINSIYDYITEEYEIIPRDFETNFSIGFNSIIYNKNDGSISDYDCPNFNGELHHHDDLIFCSEPEIVALKFIQQSIFSKYKFSLISTLHSWLPSATVDSVSVQFTNVYIVSHLEPSYCVTFLDSFAPFDCLNYYFKSNIDYSNFCESQLESFYELNNKEKVIMVRARSRSRSTSPATTRTRRGRSRSKSPQTKVGRSRRRRSSRARSSSINMSKRNRSRSPAMRTNRRRRSRSSSR